MGYFSRYQSPYAPGVDPRTGQPLRSPLMATPAPGAMPWDMASGGQGFADMYAPQPKPMAPARPVARPSADPFAPLPPMAAQPQIQQASLDPIYGFEGQTGGQQMPMGSGFDPSKIDPAQAAYDPSMLAYMPQKDMQEQPGDQATGQGNDWLNGKAFGGALGGITGDLNGMDMLSLGLSLLGNSQNGGDWGQVGKDLMGINQGVQQRKDRELSMQDREREIKRQEEADKRNAELFGYQVDELKAGQAEREYAAKNRDRLVVAQKNFVDTATDPAIKAAVEAMDPKEFGAFLGNRILRQEDKDAELAAAQTQREFMAGENAKDRASRASLAKLEAELNPRRDPTDTIQYRADIQRATPWIAAADQARTYTLGRIDRMKQIVTELTSRGGVNNPLDANFRIELSRLTGSAQENQALLEEYNNLATGFTLDEVQKLKPASNLDFEVIRKTLPNPNNNPAASMKMLNRMESELQAGIKTADAMAEWMDAGNSLSGKNKDGKTFQDVYGVEIKAPPSGAGTSAPSAGALGGSIDLKNLPKTAQDMDAIGLREGGIMTDETTGQKYKRVGSQLVPVGIDPTKERMMTGRMIK